MQNDVKDITRHGWCYHQWEYINGREMSWMRCKSCGVYISQSVQRKIINSNENGGTHARDKDNPIS